LFLIIVNVLGHPKGCRGVNFLFPPWGWYGCFLEWLNFTKLRKILPNVGFPNNYVIIMPKNNSYVIKVEKICQKMYVKILVAFIVLQFRLLFITLPLGMLLKKHTFLSKRLLIIKTFRLKQKNSLPNFLENSQNFTKSKTFYQIWSHWLERLIGILSLPIRCIYSARLTIGESVNQIDESVNQIWSSPSLNKEYYWV
jgi:hypothetical protein